MAAIQTFPKNFKINGPQTEIQRQIGNAVPSLMSEILAREIASQFFNKSFDEPLILSVPRCETIPEPELVQDVPDRYLHLLGDRRPVPIYVKGQNLL